MPNYILKTVQADGSSYGGFVWPLEVGAQVVAPDFNTDAFCGGGLHGLLNGCGNGALLNWGDGAVKANVAYRLNENGKLVKA